MSDEEKTCKTCTWFNSEAFFCRTFDTAMAEWDGCNSHETYDEMLKRLEDTQMFCNEHGFFQKNYKHCPYCALLLIPPVLRVVTRQRNGEGG